MSSTVPVDRITFVNVAPPAQPDINAELQWLGAALGLFGERDKDSSCFRVFVSILRAARHNAPVRSDDIAEQCALSRGTVVHHLNRLRDAGLVVTADGGYALAGASLHEALRTVREDVANMLGLLEAVAEDIERRIR